MSVSESHKPQKLWWDFRYIWMFISTIWVFFMLGGLFTLWQVTWIRVPYGTEAIRVSFPMWQHNVLRLTLLGRSVSEIAYELSLTEGTIRNCLSEAMNELGAANRFDAARVAESRGWV